MPMLTRSGAPTLHYEVHDFTDPWREAPWVLLQHGFSRSARFWYAWVPYLARHYRVLCPDLRGLGRSPADFDLAAGITAESYLADLDALLDHLGIRSAHYCGESLGGIIGMIYAATRPERVRTLALVAAPVFINPFTQNAFAFGHPTWQDALRSMGSEAWSRAANGATRFPADADPGLQAWYAAETGKSNVDVLIAISRLASKVDAREWLPKIAAPVLGLYPSGGAVTSDEQERLLREGIRDLRMIHLPSRHHAVMNILPGICARQLLRFVALHDGMVADE